MARSMELDELVEHWTLLVDEQERARQRDLQREINEGRNIVESWDRANSVIFFGKGDDIATNRRDEQRWSVPRTVGSANRLRVAPPDRWTAW